MSMVASDTTLACRWHVHPCVSLCPTLNDMLTFNSTPQSSITYVMFSKQPLPASWLLSRAHVDLVLGLFYICGRILFISLGTQSPWDNGFEAFLAVCPLLGFLIFQSSHRCQVLMSCAYHPPPQSSRHFSGAKLWSNYFNTPLVLVLSTLVNIYCPVSSFVHRAAS